MTGNRWILFSALCLTLFVVTARATPINPGCDYQGSRHAVGARIPCVGNQRGVLICRQASANRYVWADHCYPICSERVKVASQPQATAGVLVNGSRTFGSTTQCFPNLQVAVPKGSRVSTSRFRCLRNTQNQLTWQNESCASPDGCYMSGKVHQVNAAIPCPGVNQDGTVICRHSPSSTKKYYWEDHCYPICPVVFGTWVKSQRRLGSVSNCIVTRRNNVNRNGFVTPVRYRCELNADKQLYWKLSKDCTPRTGYRYRG